MTYLYKKKNKKVNSSSRHFIPAPSPCPPSQTQAFWDNPILLKVCTAAGLGDPAGPWAGSTVVARAAHTGAVPARGHGNADGSHAAGTASVEYFGAAERAFL